MSGIILGLVGIHSAGYRRTNDTDPLSCSNAYRSHLCSTWPAQSIAENVSASVRVRTQQVVADIMRSFPEGIREGQLADLMQRPCMQRLCMHVQLVGGAMFVVAPMGMRTCVQGNATLQARLSCPRLRRNWPTEAAEMCLASVRNRNVTRSSFCDRSHRMQQPGLTIPNWWSDYDYPHTLEWHLAAALNLSSCQAHPEHVPLPGDHNHIYTRLRLQSALRLVLRAYERLYALGRLVKPLELLLCPYLHSRSFKPETQLIYACTINPSPS